MKHTVWIFCTTLLVLSTSCNNHEENSTNPANDTTTSNGRYKKVELPLSGCYLMTHKNDTAKLILNTVQSDTVFGTLEYKLFEKDHNNGVINGLVRDNLVIVNYTFQSEGMSSVREVVFSIKADSLFEGYGETKVIGDTSRFVNINALRFMPNPFVRVECDKN